MIGCTGHGVFCAWVMYTLSLSVRGGVGGDPLSHSVRAGWRVAGGED